MNNLLNFKKIMNFSLIIIVLTFVGCANIGNDFSSSEVTSIHVGKTTQNEIRGKFGTPWRVGLEDGIRTWTYGIYHYGLFDKSTSRDLVIRFDDNNVVKSYSFNSTDINDIKK